MPTLGRTAARDNVAPALHKAQGAVTGTVVPVVATTLAVARDKGGELLDSDVAWEARRRGAAMVKAARGQTTVVPSGRRWKFGLGMITIGTGLGFAFAWLARKLQTPVESYSPSVSPTLPVPSGTDGGAAAPSGTPTDEINLSAGAPTTF